MINTVVIDGYLVRDAEVLGDGQKPFLKFCVAVNERVKKNDEWQDYANFIDCVKFNGDVDKLAKHLYKGRKVTVQGQLHQNRWQNKDGEARSKLEIRALSVAFDPKATQQQNDSEQVSDVYDEDIPF